MNLQNRNIRLTNIFLLLLMAFTLLFHSNTTHAEDYSNNIGFMKNPPKELKEKFPMCDQFLDVKWIKQFPEGNWVGMVTTDVYFGDKKEQRELVMMQRLSQGGPCSCKHIHIIDVSESSYKGKVLEMLIRSADSAFAQYWIDSDAARRGFAVKSNGKLLQVSKASGKTYIFNSISKRILTNPAQNVCVVLLKSDIGWLFENKINAIAEIIKTIELK